MESKEKLIEKYGSIRKASKELGIPESTLRRQLKSTTSKKFEVREIDRDQLEILSIDDRIKTVDEAIKKAEINLNEWEEYKSEVTSWEVAMKMGNKEDGFCAEVIPLWRVHAKFQRKKPNYIDSTIEELKIWNPYYKVPRVPVPLRAFPHALEISLFDSHLGKLCWGAETGIDYDTNIASDIFVSAVENLIEITDPYEVEQIMFPIGQDFFNVDNWRNETQRGTRQDVDHRFQKVFEIGCKSIIRAIDYCLTKAPVKVIWVPGNHDWETSWYMAQVIDAWFQNVPEVNVDKSPSPRKYWSYGNTLVGLTHGDKEKHNKLPLIMATEKPVEFSSAIDRRWHLGHFHRKSEQVFTITTTLEGGVVIEILPSLSAADSWHHQQGYINGRQAAIAYLYSKTQGLVGNFWSYA